MTDNRQPSGWRKRALLFLTSQCITLFGSTLVQMALVWYAAMETASGGWVAAFSVCSYLPQFLVSFLGGVWADRYNRKALIIGADVLIACATLAMIPALPHIPSGPALLGGLLVMSLLRSLGAGIQAPAVNAAIPQLVPEDQLMRYNGLNAAMQSLVNFAAPAAAGAVFAVSDLRTTLMIDVVTAVVGTGLLSCLALPGQRGTRERSPLLADIRAGVSCAFSHRLAGRLLVLYGLVTFFCVPGGYLAGLFVRRTFGETYWYLTAVELAGFAGMIAGGVLMSTWGGFRRRGRTLTAGLLAFGVLAAGMGLSRHFVPYLGLMALYAAKALAARPLPCALAVFALMLLAMAAQVSYGWLGVALCLAYAYAGDSKKRQALFTVLLTLLYAFTLLLSGVARTWVAVSLCAALSVIPIVLYNGRPGPRGKALTFFFYAAYPLHLCALALIRVMRIIPPYFWG